MTTAQIEQLTLYSQRFQVRDKVIPSSPREFFVARIGTVYAKFTQYVGPTVSSSYLPIHALEYPTKIRGKS